MKKIIAALLILCCMFSVVSCSMFGGGEQDDTGLGNIDEATAAQIDKVLSMFDDSIPTQSETKTTETVGNVIIESSAYLVTGTVGGKRSVLKRFERVKLMKERGQWKQGQSPIGLPKTKFEA